MVADRWVAALLCILALIVVALICGAVAAILSEDE